MVVHHFMCNKKLFSYFYLSFSFPMLSLTILSYLSSILFLFLNPLYLTNTYIFIYLFSPTHSSCLSSHHIYIYFSLSHNIETSSLFKFLLPNLFFQHFIIYNIRKVDVLEITLLPFVIFQTYY